MTTPTTQPTRTVWSDLVGQRPTIEVLQQAAAGHGRWEHLHTFPLAGADAPAD